MVEQQHEPSSSSTFLRMSVDVRLCGSIPRKDLKTLAPTSSAPCSLKGLKECFTSGALPPLNDKLFASTNGSTEGTSTLAKTAICDVLQGIVHNTSMRGILTEKQPQTLGHVLEPPSWAVPAQGESRLEPACDTVGRQSAVDLTSQPCFRVGRSPNMDIQLLHATSSRRHAMLFHHSNGSCYVVDCGSAHGTFVNGIRIASPSNGGVVVPHKVKRGALIRFGGPGAPCFLLKSFSFHLNEIDDLAEPDMGELVRRNTRFNALGRTAADSFRNSLFVSIDSALAVTRKRSFDSLDSRATLDEEPCGKRMRCSSPPPSPEEPPVRLVSPDLPLTITKRVTFSQDPPQLFFPALVTPEELSSEEDNNECI